jgi:hypothetical protein
MRVSRRPLVFVSGLTLGDYLLWNWSLNGNHDVIALISGLTLPPLAVVLLWMLALGLARLLAGAARRPKLRAGRATQRKPRRAAVTSANAQPASPDAASSKPSRKLAA